MSARWVVASQEEENFQSRYERSKDNAIRVVISDHRVESPGTAYYRKSNGIWRAQTQQKREIWQNNLWWRLFSPVPVAKHTVEERGEVKYERQIKNEARNVQYRRLRCAAAESGHLPPTSNQNPRK